MAIKLGDKVPQATFRTMTSDGPQEVTSDELFSGKKVALFALPGAFTPTCSVKHLPGYVQQADAIKAKGVEPSPAPRSTTPSSWAPGAMIRAPATRC